MTLIRMPSLLALATLIVLGGCATRPINPPLTRADPGTGYRLETRQAQSADQDNRKDSLVILAFSGGGTRAAAFSYGVLEFLRRTEVTLPNGNTSPLLNHVDIITGVSGGSFTALAYGLYGDRLFSEYEQRFLKRDVQGEIVARDPESGQLGQAVVDAAGAAPSWRRSCTTKSSSTAPPSAISTAATGR